MVEVRFMMRFTTRPSAQGYALNDGLSKNILTRPLMRSLSIKGLLIDRLHINGNSHTWIEIWPAPTELVPILITGWPALLVCVAGPLIRVQASPVKVEQLQGLDSIGRQWPWTCIAPCS